MLIPPKTQEQQDADDMSAVTKPDWRLIDPNQEEVEPVVAAQEMTYDEALQIAFEQLGKAIREAENEGAETNEPSIW